LRYFNFSILKGVKQGKSEKNFAQKAKICSHWGFYPNIFPWFDDYFETFSFTKFKIFFAALIAELASDLSYSPSGPPYCPG